MKKSIAFMALALSFVLVGCWHSISVYSKGVGAELAWRPEYDNAIHKIRII